MFGIVFGMVDKHTLRLYIFAIREIFAGKINPFFPKYQDSEKNNKIGIRKSLD